MFIIVISGLPGSGKSHLAEYIAEKLKLPMICKDSIKEVLFDTIGFRNRGEKIKVKCRHLLKSCFMLAKNY